MEEVTASVPALSGATYDAMGEMGVRLTEAGVTA